LADHFDTIMEAFAASSAPIDPLQRVRTWKCAQDVFDELKSRAEQYRRGQTVPFGMTVEVSQLVPPGFAIGVSGHNEILVAIGPRGRVPWIDQYVRGYTNHG
jgi:hypothetical protein